MRKQEIFILLVTFGIWAVTIGGRPFLGLLYYHLYRALEYQTLFFEKLGSIRIPFVTSILLIGSLLIKKKRLFFSDQSKVMILLCGFVLLSRFANGLELFGHKYVLFLCKNVIFHIMIINLIDSEKKLKIYLWTFVISGAALAFVARYNDMSIPYYWMNKNDFATDLIPACAFILAMVLSEKKLVLKGEALVYTIIILYGIIGTNSRGGYLALCAVVCLLAVRNLKVKQVIFLVLVLSLVLSRVSDVHWERFLSIRHEATEQSGTAGQRIAAWKTAMRMIEANPVLGVGTGEFTYSFARYASAEELAAAGGKEINTHNTILQVAAENGVPGLALMMIIFILSFKDLISAWSMARRDPRLGGLLVMIEGIGIALIGFLTAGFFANKAYNFPLYTLTALTVVSRDIATKMKSGESKATQEHGEEVKLSDRHDIIVRCIVFGVAAYIGIFN